MSDTTNQQVQETAYESGYEDGFKDGLHQVTRALSKVSLQSPSCPPLKGTSVDWETYYGRKLERIQRAIIQAAELLSKEEWNNFVKELEA